MTYKRNTLISPFVKWAGGKRQLLPVLSGLLPKKIKAYCEPFVGGGALFFSQQPPLARINDVNKDLINAYLVIRDDVEKLIDNLKRHCNTLEHFYTVRDMDRNPELYSKMSNVQRAARLIYLNKTCYNGLFRVNNAGEFNTPFGNYKNPNIVNAPTLRAISCYLSSNQVDFSALNYIEVLKTLDQNFFVYLDPPYDPVSTTANFTGYSRGGFGREEQHELCRQCGELDRRGIAFMLSNSDTPFIRELYARYTIKTVQAKRPINANAQGRGDINEVVIRNYD